MGVCVVVCVCPCLSVCTHHKVREETHSLSLSLFFSLYHDSAQILDRTLALPSAIRNAKNSKWLIRDKITQRE